MGEEHVKVTGLRELQRAVQRIDRGYGREINKVLRVDVALPAALEVRGEVEARGLVGATGDLLRSIKPFSRLGVAGVRSSPPLRPGKNSPRGYAPVYEFGHNKARAFMQPVFDRWLATGRTEREMTKVLDWAEGQWGAK